MKIVHVVAGIEAANGAAVIACGIARAQARMGHEVLLATLAGPGPTCPLDGVRVMRFPRGFPRFVFFSWGLMRGLGKMVRGADFVHVHCSWTFPVWWGAWCAVRRGVRLVMTPEGSFDPVRLAHSAWKKRLAAGIERWCVRRAWAVHATVPREAEWVRAFAPQVRKVVVVPPGVDVPPSAPAGSMDGRRGISLLYLGRRHPLKGLDVLEDAIRRVRESGGPEIALRVESAVYGAEKERVLASCDALALPTRSENFGLVVAEALAAGKPVVVTDGAPWEAVRAKGCGWFVEGFAGVDFDRERAVGNLVRALEACAETPRAEREAMGARGRAWMAADYAWDRVAARLMEALA